MKKSDYIAKKKPKTTRIEVKDYELEKYLVKYTTKGWAVHKFEMIADDYYGMYPAIYEVEFIKNK